MNDGRRSWLEQILFERFGHKFALLDSPAGMRIRLADVGGEILVEGPVHADYWLGTDMPCVCWDPRPEGWLSTLRTVLPAPGVAKLPLPLIERHEDQYVIHYDILGLAYWMLARVEEVGRTDLDDHRRFPAKASHAYSHGYLHRPLVDEWFDILRQVIRRTWPGIELKEHQFGMKVSHDVDRPLQYCFMPASKLARMVGGDLVKRHDPQLALRRVLAWRKVTGGDVAADPFNTFDWIMDLSERHGLRSAFYFICGRTDRQKDADYEIEHPFIRELLRRIHSRGHEIGLHPSYDTYLTPEAIRDEAQRLRRVCAEEHVEQREWGGRMHYLRWRQPITLHGWEAAGMEYDSSLGYADHPGFRCGTCFEYPAFDPVGGGQLKVRIRPLIAIML